MTNTTYTLPAYIAKDISSFLPYVEPRKGSSSPIPYAYLDYELGGRDYVDITCPLCSASRKERNQKLKVLRVWRKDNDAASFNCAHCGEHGIAFANNTTAYPIDEVERARRQAEAAEHNRKEAADRLRLVHYLWTCSVPLVGTLGETYLRKARGYGGPLPDTLRYLPASPPKYPHPAIVAAFGLPTEPEPGLLRMAESAVLGIQLIKLAADGSAKAGTDADKITIGKCMSAPLVMAPMGDLLGLWIAEGIEDALSLAEAFGVGAWAAGGAPRMAALAPTVPTYTDCVRIVMDTDPDGQKGAHALASALQRRFAATPTIELVHLGGVA